MTSVKKKVPLYICSAAKTCGFLDLFGRIMADGFFRCGDSVPHELHSENGLCCGGIDEPTKLRHNCGWGWKCASPARCKRYKK